MGESKVRDSISPTFDFLLKTYLWEQIEYISCAAMSYQHQQAFSTVFSLFPKKCLWKICEQSSVDINSKHQHKFSVHCQYRRWTLGLILHEMSFGCLTHPSFAIISHPSSSLMWLFLSPQKKSLSIPLLSTCLYWFHKWLLRSSQSYVSLSIFPSIVIRNRALSLFHHPFLLLLWS